MRKPGLSAKRIAIDKTNASLMVIVSITVFVVIFSIVATRALYSQLTYQSKVINAKEKTLKITEKNLQEVQRLETAYQEFAGSTENSIGGNPKGSGDRDGENARIILDALPSKYDFPALNTSMEKLIRSGGFQLSALSGTDDEIAQSANQSSSTPLPIDIPFSLEAKVSPSDGERFLQLFEKSIRPIQVQKIAVTTQDNQLKVKVTAKTYFQPEKNLNVTEEVVK